MKMSNGFINCLCGNWEITNPEKEPTARCDGCKNIPVGKPKAQVLEIADTQAYGKNKK